MLFPAKHWVRLSSLNVSLIGSMPPKILVKTKTKLRYYATFKVRKFESLFYKINTCLQKIATCIVLQAEQIFSVNI